MKLTMYKGLPASGKSTDAKAAVVAGKGRVKRVNKDDLRDMIDVGRWSKEREKFVLHVRDSMVRTWLNAGFDVLVDDTNLHPKHENTLRRIAQEYEAEFVIKDFTNVSLYECLQRDEMREKSVGRRVITRMWEQFLKPEPPKTNPLLPYCIIVDIDGTVANNSNRSPYDESKVSQDTPIDQVVTILDSMSVFDTELCIFFFSGRSEDCRKDTERWLLYNVYYYDELFMRKSGDSRPDTVVKKEMYKKYIEGKYNVVFVIDDRLSVSYMWYELGLFVFNVNQGLVEF